MVLTVSHFMKIHVGSKNPVKIQAVEEVLGEYSHFHHAIIIPVDALSEVSKQPHSFEETLEGAKNRAENAFHYCNYSLGIESGIIIPADSLEATICTIYDGKKHSFGLSPSFQIPPAIARLLAEGHDLAEATYKLELTTNPKLGSAEGIIGLLTHSRVTRKDYTKQAIHMALIKILNPELYKTK